MEAFGSKAVHGYTCCRPGCSARGDIGHAKSVFYLGQCEQFFCAQITEKSNIAIETFHTVNYRVSRQTVNRKRDFFFATFL